MTLLILLLSIALERYTQVASYLKRFAWLNAYFSKLLPFCSKQKKWLNAWLVAIISPLPILFVVGFLLCLFSGWIYNLTGLVIGTLFLFYCYGPQSYYNLLSNYLSSNDAKEGQGATVNALLSEKLSGKEATHAVNAALICRFYESIFAVIFYFVVFGPYWGIVVAFAYRFIQLAQRHFLHIGRDNSGFALSKPFTVLKDILDYVPVRVLVLVLALVGDFQKVYPLILSDFIKGLGHSHQLLTDCANAVQNKNKNFTFNDNKKAAQLLFHALIATLVLTALFTIVAWVY